MDKPALEILIIFLLLVINGFFAMSEMSIVASRRIRLQQRAAQGSPQAKLALDLASNPSRFLSTIQMGITLIGILAGAFGGKTLSESLENHLTGLPVIGPYSGAISVAVVVLGITYFSLLIGELVPKRVALNNAEAIAQRIAKPMKVLSTIASPLVRFLSISTDGTIRVLELMGMRPSPSLPVTEEEVKLLIEQGTKVGVFEEAEQDMIERVLRLGERRVGALMTPRSQVFWLDSTDSPEEIRQKLMASPHSRLPVAEKDIENVLGVLHIKDVLARCLQDKSLDLKGMLREPLFVPEQMPLLMILDVFKQKGTHMALVVDEYGGLQGLITHNDILEGIAGDLPLIGGEEEPAVTHRDDGSFLVDGLLRMDKLKEILDMEDFADEESGRYQTVGGFVINRLGRIPSPGQWFEWGKYRFEILDMDWPRVDKVLVMAAPPPKEGEEAPQP